MDEHHADLRRIDLRVVAGHAPDEVVQLGHHLDAREAASRHHEGEELLAQPRVVLLDGGLFQGADEVVAQVERVLQVLEGQRVLGQPAQATEVGDRAECEHQVVVAELVRVRQEARRGGDGPPLEVDRLHLADVQLGSWDELADGADQVGEPDGAGDDLGQHGLEDEVVLLADEHDLEVALPGQQLLQAARGEDAAESAAQDDDPLPAAGDVRAASPLFAEDAALVGRVDELGAAAGLPPRIDRRGQQHSERRSDEVDPERRPVSREERGGERSRRVHAGARKRRFAGDV